MFEPLCTTLTPSCCLPSGPGEPVSQVGTIPLPGSGERSGLPLQGARALCAPQVSLNSDLTPSNPDEVCVDVGPLLLAPGGFFGVSAATSTLAGEGP